MREHELISIDKYIKISILLTLAFISGCASKNPPLEDKNRIESKSTSIKGKKQFDLNSLSIADKNLIESNSFLAENRAHPDIAETSSGLQYKKLKLGYGCRPNPNASVTVHYESRLATSNTPFDSSYQRRVPGTYSLKQMIPAWAEGIPLMQEGDIWEFYVPPNLAFGLKGSPPVIGPNVITIFKVELIKSGLCK